MTNKKENAGRLALFVVLALLLSALMLLFIVLFRESETVVFLCELLMMWTPAAAGIITRAVTREGFRDMKLHLHLGGNLRYYIIAFFLPIVIMSATYILPVALSGHVEWLSGFTFTTVISAFLMLISYTAITSVRVLGEELGWRAYMNQKMEPLLGVTGTCITGGIVWGLWHLPMDLIGYFTGNLSLGEVFSMSGGRLTELVFFAVPLMWLTKKTDSVWPAVVCHCVYNYTTGLIAEILVQGAPENADPGIIMDVFRYLPMIVAAAVFLVLMLRDKRKTENDIKNTETAGQ